jgi:nicotinamidase-related amidase
VAIDTRRSAVLALHWQINVIKPEGFFGGMLAEPVARSGVVERATHFHGAAGAAGLPILFTVPEDGGLLVANTAFMTAVAASGPAFAPSAPGAQLIPEMAPQAEPDQVFDNQKLSGLAGSALPKWLAEHGIDTVLITGVATNLTVEQTARHATDLGLTTYVMSDCVAAADQATHAASLANLELATAGCRTADQVL